MFFSLYLCADNISQEEMDRLESGEFITKSKWKEEFTWPEVTVFKILKYSPKQNLDIFTDFEKHKDYIPDMLFSKVIKKINSNQLHVKFEMSMPWPVNKTSHTTNNLILNNKDGSYTLKWNLVNGKMLSATDGYMKFSPYKDQTLLTYVSQIVPNSALAGMFKNRVEGDVEKTVKAISKHLEETINLNNKVVNDK